MLCSRPRPLNASATVAGLPDAQRERPSRAAGSFVGHDQSFEAMKSNCPEATFLMSALG
jgi:hypothetical protein